MAPISCGTHGAQNRLAAASPKVDRLVRCLVSTLLTFLRNPPNPPSASNAWHHSHFVTLFLISGYCDISEWYVGSARARVNTCIKFAPN